MPYSVAEAHSFYERLPEFSAARLREISGMSQPFIAITDRQARLVARLTNLLGHTPPRDTQDRVIRDLLADTFDFLYESRSLIIGGKLTLAYPLARRAYESLSLLHLCSLDYTWAEKWECGKEIGNAEVRKQLGRRPMGESEAEMKILYAFFSEASHPNRDLVSSRLLGEGNQFVLGLIGKPNLFFVVDYCAKLLDLWHWIVATVTYFYREVISVADLGYFKEYQECFEQASFVKKWLVENLEHLRTEALALARSEGHIE